MINGKLYYFNINGVMFTGFKRKDANTAYYFSPADGAAVTGFVPINNLTYYFYGKDGTKTGLQTIEDNKYYLSSSGTLMSGFKRVDGVAYYFDEKTKRAVTGFISPGNGYTYYLTGITVLSKACKRLMETGTHLMRLLERCKREFGDSFQLINFSISIRKLEQR